MPQKEYKAALAYAAGLAVAPRYNTLPFRPTVSKIETTERPEPLCVHSNSSLKRKGATLHMSSTFTDPDAERSLWIKEPKSVYALQEEIEHDLLDLLPSPTSDGESVHARFSFESTSTEGSVENPSVNSADSSLDDFSATSLSTTLSSQWHCSTQLSKESMPRIISIDDSGKLSMYIALSNGVQGALKFAHLPALPSACAALNGSADQSQTKESLLSLPELFRSLCICDTKIKGNPIYLRSRFFSLGPRGLRIARCQFLNLPPGKEDDCFTMSCRTGADGKPQFVLEYAASLVSQETELRTWVLAALMDVTDVVEQLATDWIEAGNEYSNTATSSSIDWPSIASKQDGTQDEKTAIDIDVSAATALHSLLHRIRSLHQYCFTLTATPSKSFWQISWTSPALNREGFEDIIIAFSLSELATLRTLEDALGADQPRTVEDLSVRWGAEGRQKRLWAVPMFRDKLDGWLCFLVDG